MIFHADYEELKMAFSYTSVLEEVVFGFLQNRYF